MDEIFWSPSVHLAILWGRIGISYLCNLWLLRLCAKADENKRVATRYLSKKIKYMLFLFPLIRAHKFALFTLLCASVNQILMAVQLLLLVIKTIGISVDNRVLWCISTAMFLTLIACIFISILCAAIMDFRRRRRR